MPNTRDRRSRISPAVASRPPETQLAFPFNWRAGMALWNGLFHTGLPLEADASKSDAWNRGAYWVESLGHCGACHTPRNALGAEIGGLLAQRGVAALGVAPDDVQSYGKGAIVGTDGELEHTAAVLHPRFGASVRAAIGGGADIIPGTKKVAGPGASITMPIGNKDDRWEFDDMDSAEITIGDAPRANEMVIAIVYSVGGRPHARVTKVK